MEEYGNIDQEWMEVSVCVYWSYFHLYHGIDIRDISFQVL